VALLFADGSGVVIDLISGAPPTPIAGSDIRIEGNSLSVTLSRALLPSTGFAFRDYAYNLWPRYAPAGVDAGDNTQISDLAPDGGTITAVPVPAALGLQLTGAALVAFAGARRARRRRPV
jgi:hypothetical protein